MKVLKAASYPIQIFIAGDINIAKQVCRKFCMEVGECVNIQKTTYIYTGGEEEGVIITFINYPRFPRSSNEILLNAKKLGLALLAELCQTSFSIQTPTDTIFVSNKKDERNSP